MPETPGALSVLIVEDQELNRQSLSRILGRLGHSAQLAANAEEALDALSRDAFDLILMDIELPGMDGYRASREIRRRGIPGRGGSPVPIIAVTANSSPAEQKACLDSGINEVVAKPVSFDQIASLCTRWANR